MKPLFLAVFLGLVVVAALIWGLNAQGRYAVEHSAVLLLSQSEQQDEDDDLYPPQETEDPELPEGDNPLPPDPPERPDTIPAAFNN